ncbi:MAG: diguanylate cyclase [Pseudomonadota bacterium]|nr:diguanylate cyclase [Pseudomonadota bacterium]
MPLFVVLLFMLSAPALANVDVGGTAFSSAAVTSSVRFLEDAPGQLRLQDILTIPDNDWKRNNGHYFSRGYSRSAWWLKVPLSNSSAATLSRYLEIAYPNLDQIQVFVVAGVHTTTFNLGDKLPFHQRPIKSNNYVIPLRLPPNSQQDVYLRIRSDSAVQVPLTLWEKQHYYDWARVESLLQGFYFGVMAVMTLYNLFVFLAVRERNFILYVCFASSLPMFIAGLKGFSFEYFWPNYPHLNNHAIVVPLCLALFFGALFTESFLKVRQLGQWAVSLFRIQQASILLMLLVSLVVSYPGVIRLLIPLAILSCCLGLMFGILMWNRGGLAARYYTVGWCAFLSGGLVLGLNKLGVLPTNAFTENTLQVGSGVEVILLSFALAASINEDRRLRSEAQSEALRGERETRMAREQALQIQQQATEELEFKVQERTTELEQLNRQLSELSDTDQLTGLKNRRYLDRVLLEELTRCRRYGRGFSVILLDIDHFKQFNDQYGHMVGDDCLKAVASVLAESVREGVDWVARYGGEEFCILLPETSLTCAQAVAERLRQGVYNMPFKVRDTQVTVSISLGVTEVPSDQESTPEQLIAQADSALYQAKQNGRNCTVLADNRISAAKPTTTCHNGRKLG